MQIYLLTLHYQWKTIHVVRGPQKSTSLAPPSPQKRILFPKYRCHGTLHE